MFERTAAEARRAAILDAAIDVFGRLGFRQGSLRDVAAAVGMTVQGVLYYFASKELLLMAVLERRTEVRTPQIEAIERERGVVALMRYFLEENLARPGLMRLFVTLAAEATDPDHPAHTYFVDRYRRLHEHLRAGVVADIAAGRIPREVDPADAAVKLVTLSDGLQLQYLLRPDLDLLLAYDLNTADLRGD